MIEKILEIFRALPAACARARAKQALPNDPYLSPQAAGFDHPLLGVHQSLPEGDLNILMSLDGTLYAAYWEKDAEELGIHGYHMWVTRLYEAATALQALPDSPFGKIQVDLSWMLEDGPEEADAAGSTSDLVETIQSEVTSDSEVYSERGADSADREGAKEEGDISEEEWDGEPGEETPNQRRWREAVEASVAGEPPERRATELPFRELLEDIPLCGDRARLNPEEEAALRVTFEAALRAVVVGRGPAGSHRDRMEANFPDRVTDEKKFA
jgi:hypothetical protein